jgi:murein lipoprotein
MRLKILVAAAAAVLVLAGCEGGAPVKPSEPMTELSSEATGALEQARADVAAVKKQPAELWTTADQALKNAEDAAKKGDSAAVLKNARAASEFAKLGTIQAKYPLTHF